MRPLTTDCSCLWHASKHGYYREPGVADTWDQSRLWERGIGNMMTSWYGNTFGITGPLLGESADHKWILLTTGLQRRALMFYLLVRKSCGTNSQVVGNLRCHGAHVISNHQQLDCLFHHIDQCHMHVTLINMMECPLVVICYDHKTGALSSRFSHAQHLTWGSYVGGFHLSAPELQMYCG